MFDEFEIVMKKWKKDIPSEIHQKVLSSMDRLNKKGITNNDIMQVLVEFGMVGGLCKVIKTTSQSSDGVSGQ